MTTPRLSRFRPNVIPFVGVAAVVLSLVWAGTNGYDATLVVTGCMYALVALGMYVPFVLCGTLSMAYSAYAAISGYAIAILVIKSGLPSWVGWLVGPSISAVLAVIVGWTTRRLSGFYLVAVTLLFAEAFQNWVGSTSIAGGQLGFGNLSTLSVFGWSPDYTQFDIAAAALVCLIAVLVDRLRNSPWGIVTRALREVPHAVEATGVRVPTVRLVALAIGAAIGSLGGCLFTSSVHSVNPSTFTLDLVFIAVFVPIIGGVGTAWGCVIGALVVTDLTINVTALGQSGTLIVALGVLFILLLAPGGITGVLEFGNRQLSRLVQRVSGRRD